MTNMRRVSIALPKDLDERIMKLRKDDRFVRCSYSELVRKALVLGLMHESLSIAEEKSD